MYKGKHDPKSLKCVLFVTVPLEKGIGVSPSITLFVNRNISFRWAISWFRWYYYKPSYEHWCSLIIDITSNAVIHKDDLLIVVVIVLELVSTSRLYKCLWFFYLLPIMSLFLHCPFYLFLGTTGSIWIPDLKKTELEETGALIKNETWQLVLIPIRKYQMVVSGSLQLSWRFMGWAP